MMADAAGPINECSAVIANQATVYAAGVIFNACILVDQGAGCECTTTVTSYTPKGRVRLSFSYRATTGEFMEGDTTSDGSIVTVDYSYVRLSNRPQQST